MAKKKAIIIFPHLNDCGGDLKKDWYVEFKYQIPGEPEMRKERIYKGIYSGPEADRRKEAARVIKEKTKWLKTGVYLEGNLRKVYADELLYRNEAKMFGMAHDQVVTTRTNLSEFLVQTKEKVNAKSYENYVSKLRTFNAWLKLNKLDRVHIKNITRQHIIDFTIYLSSTTGLGLSRLTIKKYIQIVNMYFNFELDRGVIPFNPVVRIPTVGKIVDCASVPLQMNDRIKLKAAVSTADPQLWLASQIQYYCAIRPGTELRLLKISYIDFDNSQFRIPNVDAKNNTTEIVKIPDLLLNEMKRQGLDLFQDKSLYIFGKFGRPGLVPLGKNTLSNRFNRFREQLGISEDKKFYSWKHTGAIQLLQNGAKPYDIQGHLRHKSFTTTEVYLKKMVGNPESTVTRFTSEI